MVACFLHLRINALIGRISWGGQEKSLNTIEEAEAKI